jgi:hypothetical protein
MVILPVGNSPFGPSLRKLSLPQANLRRPTQLEDKIRRLFSFRLLIELWGNLALRVSSPLAFPKFKTSMRRSGHTRIKGLQNTFLLLRSNETVVNVQET